MKLYYKPGACSLASHIILREVGATFELEQVDTDKQTTENGDNYGDINAKGYVPALKTDQGDILTEGASILQFIADQNRDRELAPAAGSLARARLQEYLNYVASELHKAFGPHFTANASHADKERATSNISKKFDYVESLFGDGRTYLLGDNFSVADSYLFVVSNWANFVGIDLENWPRLAQFVERVSARPAVHAAMHAEGLTS